MFIVKDVSGSVVGVIKQRKDLPEGYTIREVPYLIMRKCRRCKKKRVIYARELCKPCWVTRNRKKLEKEKDLRCLECNRRISLGSDSKLCTSCSRKGERSTTWKGGNSLKYAVKTHKRGKCERCGSRKNLDVHHKDRDRRNNCKGNLETLCRSCHKIEHKDEVEHPVHRYNYGKQKKM